MKYSLSEIRTALLRANGLIPRKPVPTEQIVAILSPYYDCSEIADHSGEMADATRSMIFALTADAYRESGDYKKAASWYLKASAISPGGHAIIYAHMVCRQKLTEFYPDALKVMELHTEQWQAKPIFERVFLTVFAWRMWIDKEGREILFSVRKNLEFLRRACG